jgi:hypothetical protein
MSAAANMIFFPPKLLLIFPASALTLSERIKREANQVEEGFRTSISTSKEDSTSFAKDYGRNR